MTGDRKDQSLEGLRGLAAMSVVLTHSIWCFYPYLTYRRNPFPDARPSGWLDAILYWPPFNLMFAADAAVLVFFVLSGYVLTIKFYETRSTASIISGATRRYIRLFVPAGAAVLMAWAILSLGLMANKQTLQLGMAGWPIGYYSEPRSFTKALHDAVIGIPLYGKVYLDGPLWSIQVEFIGSMILFAAYALFGTLNIGFVAVFFLIAASYLAQGAGFLYYVAILSGSLLHLIPRRVSEVKFIGPVALGLGIIFVATDQSGLYAWLRAIPLPHATSRFDLFSDHVRFWQTVGAILLVFSVISSKRVATVLSSRIPVYLGAVSFSTYVLHMPLIMSLMFWLVIAAKQFGLPLNATFLISYPIFLALLFAVAEAFRRLVDERSKKIAKSFENWMRSDRSIATNAPTSAAIAAPAE